MNKSNQQKPQGKVASISPNMESEAIKLDDTEKLKRLRRAHEIYKLSYEIADYRVRQTLADIKYMELMAQYNTPPEGSQENKEDPGFEDFLKANDLTKEQAQEAATELLSKVQEGHEVTKEELTFNGPG